MPKTLEDLLHSYKQTAKNYGDMANARSGLEEAIYRDKKMFMDCIISDLTDVLKFTCLEELQPPIKGGAEILTLEEKIKKLEEKVREYTKLIFESQETYSKQYFSGKADGVYEAIAILR